MIKDITQERPTRLAIRTRLTLRGDGAETADPTVYCPAQERSVAVHECEGCARFHALHFEPAARITSVVCHPGTTAVAPEEEAALRAAVSGPPDPATPLSAIMTKDVVCVRADVALEQVRALLLDRGFGGLPVVDAEGKPIGVVSRADVLRVDRDRGDTEDARLVSPKDADVLGLGPGFRVFEPVRLTAGDIMSPIVLVLHESANIGQAASLMAYEGVHRLPVVADDGRIVGILSALDILRWFGRRSGYFIPQEAARRLR